MLSHTGGTGYTMQVLERAREAGAAAVHVSGVGKGGDVETVAAGGLVRLHRKPTGALLRLAQIATALGAQLGELDAVPERVAPSSSGPGR